MSVGEYSMRAFRPSHYAEPEMHDDEAAMARQANLEMYAMRAEAGLPLFEAESESERARPAGEHAA